MKTTLPFLFLLLTTSTVFSGDYSFKLKSGAIFVVNTPEGKTLDDCFQDSQLLPEYCLHIYTPEQQHYSAGSPIIIALSEFFEEYSNLTEKPLTTHSASGFSLASISKCSHSVSACSLESPEISSSSNLLELEEMEEMEHGFSAFEQNSATPISYPCLFKKCQHEFSSAGTRNLHHRVEHKDSYIKLQGEKNIKCNLCGRYFAKLQGLLRHHTSSHIGVKLFD